MNKLGTIRLETDRLILRKFTIDDYVAMYHNWAKWEECSRYFPWDSMTDSIQAKNKMLHWIPCYDDLTFFQWGIELLSERELIGVINLHNIDEENNTAETSYILSPKYWNKGLMTEALGRIITFAFQELELEKVHADCFVGNLASEVVLKKNGMTCEGLASEQYTKNGKMVDAVSYAILRESANRVL